MKHMKKILTVAAVCAASQAFADGASVSPRIVNGVDASINDWPFIVSLQDAGGHTCGGTYIGNNIVLTAAHCISDDRPILSMAFGHENVTFQESSEIGRIWVHPNYDKYTYQNDIAAIEVLSNLDLFNFTLSAANLATSSTLSSGDKLEVAGWGSTVETGVGTSSVLKKTDLRFESDTTCSNKFPSKYNSNLNICAYDFDESNPISDSCKGDSGGPLISRDSNGNATLVGIVSYGVDANCAQAGNPAVYTQVSAYSGDWLDNVTNYFASDIKVAGADTESLKDLLYRDGTSYETDTVNTVKSIVVTNDGINSQTLGRAFSDSTSITTNRSDCNTNADDTINAGESCNVTLTIDAAKLHDEQEVNGQTHLHFGELTNNASDTSKGGFTLDVNTQYQIIENIPNSNNVLGNLEFDTFGHGLWSDQGDLSYRSPNLNDSEYSSIQALNLVGPGLFTAEIKVSSERIYDGIKIYLDQNGDGTTTEFTSFSMMSGECDWQTLSVEIPAGTHSVEVLYQKDERDPESDKIIGDNASIRNVNYTAMGSYTEFSVSKNGSCGANVTPTATPTAEPTATTTPTEQTETVSSSSSSGNFSLAFLIALISLPLFRFKKVMVSLLVVLGLTACSDKEEQTIEETVAATEVATPVVKAEVATPVVKAKVAVAEVEAPVVEQVSEEKVIVRGEPLALFEYEAKQLSFAVRDNGCTKASDFRLEMNEANELEVIRLKQDGCRRATAWRTIVVSHNFSNDFQLVNPMIETTDPILPPVATATSKKPSKMH